MPSECCFLGFSDLVVKLKSFRYFKPNKIQEISILESKFWIFTRRRCSNLSRMILSALSLLATNYIADQPALFRLPVKSLKRLMIKPTPNRFWSNDNSQPTVSLFVALQLTQSETLFMLCFFAVTWKSGCHKNRLSLLLESALTLSNLLKRFYIMCIKCVLWMPLD